MQRKLFVLAVILAGVGRAIAAGPAADPSPLGTWQVTMQGTDRGVAYLTFSNNFTLTGYGISRDAPGWFEMAGTWDFDRNGKIVGGFTQFIDTGSRAGLLAGRILGAGRFSANVKTTDGPQRWSAPPRNKPAPDLTGNWVGQTLTEGTKVLQQFQLVVSTHSPGLFALDGIGINNQGTFALAGALLVTSDRRVAGVLTEAQNTNDNRDVVLYGRITRTGRRLKLTGRNDNNQNVRFRADRLGETN
jgi:hypothetical protein